ncbi:MULTISPECIES: penicillin-binding protein 1A [Candidatus Ichthyocystis]|uniref:penicillin-binding protein 1A n=1 Tax=Candidatus Ichthyocystis TaxID=2929841 RepID=UPI000ACCF702|nr:MULTISPECIES: PBP1A family penicillin-binding protein [Ichthyocystis]
MKLFRTVSIIVSVIVGIAIALFLSLAILITLTSKQLPSLEKLKNATPEIPLRIFTSDGILIAEYATKKSDIVPIGDVPILLKEAILAAEDDRFYKHPGVDWQGVVRALIFNLEGKHLQGASTITMQVAKNFFFTSERTYKRKYYEMLMAFKIDATLEKNQILELYINKIYLGNRAYGFSAAAESYFGKTLSQLNLSEIALLAGLPKAPSTYNPITNLSRAISRRRYVLGRMLDLGYISPTQYKNALSKRPIINQHEQKYEVTASYVAEMARQFLYAEYGQEIYQKGFNVYTTIRKDYQKIANAALRHNLILYTERHEFTGISGRIELDSNISVQKQLDQFHIYPPLVPSVVTKVTDNAVHLIVRGGKKTMILGSELDRLRGKKNKFVVSRGDVMYIRKTGNDIWRATGLPKAESALVSEDVSSGAILALCGGFSENRNKFNHVTQAWRQPGSSIKPLIYTAALEEGYSPETIIDDSPISFTAKETGSTPWTPRNFDKNFKGEITMWQALAESRNVPSVKILQFVGIDKARNILHRFGLNIRKQPPYLTMVLGSGLVTPWQMLRAYSIFAHNGIKINPYLIEKVTDSHGNIIYDAQRSTSTEEEVLSPQVANQIDMMLHKTITDGTGRSALRYLEGKNIAGKTGTTNDSIDTWFCGYAGNIVTVTWVGFDSPHPLGKNEYGSQTALPPWTEYTKQVLELEDKDNGTEEQEGERKSLPVIMERSTIEV